MVPILCMFFLAIKGNPTDSERNLREFSNVKINLYFTRKEKHNQQRCKGNGSHRPKVAPPPTFEDN